jgi:hypothetical protein
MGKAHDGREHDTSGDAREREGAAAFKMRVAS